ncbi:hypothetical protein P3X46_006108 [Hevea brasiliensis]|uniref:WPP domain-containing protein n=1 Tax=Hevea brasiliensis TaxID=3981 RepID=A0ABQ9MT26_HEVBR|nr:hypothetical protein P3X46_006108 [Hevea brasiliensis]
MDTATMKSQHHPFSIKLWPPSQNTRQTFAKRITGNLTTKSIFTQKIEHVAFVTANQLYEMEPDGDGGSAVQLYAKECSRLILEVLKRRSSQKEDREVRASEKAVAFHNNVFDISKGPLSFIEAREAEDILKPLKEPGNSYSKICFSNRSFGLEADQLKEVDLSDFIAGRPEAEALDSLNLSNNALGEKGVRAFGALLQSQSGLEVLYLMNDGISEEAALAVCELIPSTEKLRILHFHNNMTGDPRALAISEVLKRSPLREDFRCSSTRIATEGRIAVSEALESCTHLKKLDLRDNMFGAEARVALSKALSKHAGLNEVYLSYLNLEDEGAVALANSLKESAPTLEVLDMAGNDIRAEAAPALSACIAVKQNLRKLNLAENELKDEGAIQISKALEEGHLQLNEVDMSNNSIGRARSWFKLLNINGNFISDEGIDEVKEIFKKFPDMLGPLDENCYNKHVQI